MYKCECPFKDHSQIVNTLNLHDCWLDPGSNIDNVRLIIKTIWDNWDHHRNMLFLYKKPLWNKDFDRNYQNGFDPI